MCVSQVGRGCVSQVGRGCVSQVGRGYLSQVGRGCTAPTKSCSHLQLFLPSLPSLLPSPPLPSPPFSLPSPPLLPQFTLCHVLKGNKPDFHNAMNADSSGPMFQDFLKLLGSMYREDKIQSAACQLRDTFLLPFIFNCIVRLAQLSP